MKKNREKLLKVTDSFEGKIHQLFEQFDRLYWSRRIPERLGSGAAECKVEVAGRGIRCRSCLSWIEMSTAIAVAVAVAAAVVVVVAAAVGVA